jgi:hypothetical protein
MIVYGCHPDVTAGPFRDRPAGCSRRTSAQVRKGVPPGTRTPNPRIKSLTRARSEGFMRGRSAGQVVGTTSVEQVRTKTNGN